MKRLAPNTLIQNRYLIVHLIGKGGMGDVYLAVDQRLGSAVALKRTFFSDDEILGNAFEREAKTLARLRHPVLPKVSDHFTENGDQFLVMEHISGDDLSKRLEAMQKPFPLSWVLFWADHLLDALAYLHAHEPPIIHRDIKPQNLKLTEENYIVLLDFGLSKINNNDPRSRFSVSTGSVVGYTPHYAPMEQIRGTGTNPKSDLYSLSATLYQLMTNVVPADTLTRADALLLNGTDPLKKVSDLNPDVSEAISEVILKGMEISQDKRFSTAREMQKALRDAYASYQQIINAKTSEFNIEAFPPLDLNSKHVKQSDVETEVIVDTDIKVAGKDIIADQIVIEDPGTETVVVTKTIESEDQQSITLNIIETRFQEIINTTQNVEKMHTTMMGRISELTEFLDEAKSNISLTQQTSFFSGDKVRYEKIQETISFYRTHLGKDYEQLSRQATYTYNLWLVCVAIGFILLFTAVGLLIFGKIAEGVVTLVSGVIPLFVRKIFQQREDDYRALANIKNEHLKAGDRWLMIIQTIDAMEDQGKKARAQAKLIEVLTKNPF